MALINGNSSITAPYSEGNPQRIYPEDVNTYTLKDFGLDVDSVKEQIFGMEVVDPVTGKALPDSYYEKAIKSAVAWAEKEFDIKILPRFVAEERDMYINEANSFNFQRLTQRPILQVEDFNINLNGAGFVNFPSRWWKVESLGGTLQIVPGFGSIYGSYNQGLNGSLPLITQGAGNNFMGNYTRGSNSYPQAYHVNYVAGMLPPEREGVEQVWEMPQDLKWVLLKEAAKDVLQIWARLILSPGIAQQSLSIDGISEQKTTTASAMYGGAKADIMQLNEDIEYLSKGLRAKFGVRVTML